MNPRARDDVRNIGFCGVLLGWLPGQVVCLCALVYVSIACPEGRNGSGSVTPTQRETSRTRCVWGNTVVPELPSPPQRARPFHSHSIQTQASPFHLSIAKSCRPKQVHSTFRGASSVPSPWFFGWDICSSLSSSFGVWTACSAEVPGPKPVVPSLAQEAIAFHCHRVPDSFQLPHCDGFVEVRDPLDLVRAPLVFLCSISGVFSSGRREVLGDFPGLCKILHETTLLGCPSCIPVFFSLLL